MTLANYITITRILLIPVFAILAWLYGQSVIAESPIEGYRWAALLVFSAAAAGDALDGYVARKYNQQTKLGAYLDPIADKFLMFSGIVLLSWVPWAKTTGASLFGLPGWSLFVTSVSQQPCSSSNS